MIWVIIILSVVFLICLGHRGDSAKKVASQSPAGSTPPSIEDIWAEAKRWDQTMEEKYFHSPLTKKIIVAISDGTGRKPEQIDVYPDKVVGRTGGATRVFDFLSERVPKLEAKQFKYIEAGRSNEYSTKSSPEMSLARAINRILDDEYELKSRYLDSYRPELGNQVILTLKATVNF